MAQRSNTSAEEFAPSAIAPDRLVTARELSARSTLSRSTIWRLVRDREMPAPLQLTPTRIAWRESEVAAWLRSCDQRGPHEVTA
jgi:prophage regulatory protein